MKYLDTVYLLRTASSVTSVCLHRYRVRISPNWFTLLSSTLFVLALYLAFVGNYFGVPLVILSLFFDYLDGDYARVTAQTSRLGRVFDELSDTAKIPLLMVVYFYSSAAPGLVIVVASLWMIFLRLRLLVKSVESNSKESAEKAISPPASTFRRAIAAIPQLNYANIEIFMIYLITSDHYFAVWIFAILIFYNLCRILKKYLMLMFK